MWRYQVFERKLTRYFIGVYIIKEGINDIINKQGSMYIQTWGRLKWIAINVEIF